MSTFEWQDVLMDEDNGLPVPSPKEDLPSDNEKEGEDNGQGSEAAGALSEDDDPNGMKDVPRGEDPISGTKSNEYDDNLDAFLNSITDEDSSDEDDADDAEEDKDEKDSKEKSDEEEEDNGEKDTKDEFGFDDDFLYDEEGGLPVPSPKEDLPSDNEAEGEDNGQGSEAAGALSEDDDPKGMKDVPRGEDPITGTKPNEYDDALDQFLDAIKDKDDEESDESEDDKDDKKEEQGEDKGSDDDGASKDGDTKGDDDEEIKDFGDFFVDADTEIPDGPEGTKLEPADPVDGNGDDVCPIGDPDLPSNLTEPVIVPSDDPGTKDELLNSFREDVRFTFGDF